MLRNKLTKPWSSRVMVLEYLTPSFSFFIPIYLSGNRHKDSLLTEECVLEKGVSQGNEGKPVFKCWATPQFVSALFTFCLSLPPSSITDVLNLELSSAMKVSHLADEHQQNKGDWGVKRKSKETKVSGKACIGKRQNEEKGGYAFLHHWLP